MIANTQPDMGAKTAEGFEQSFGVMHLGHFLLTKLLIPYLEKSDGTNAVKDFYLSL